MTPSNANCIMCNILNKIYADRENKYTRIYLSSQSPANSISLVIGDDMVVSSDFFLLSDMLWIIESMFDLVADRRFLLDVVSADEGCLKIAGLKLADI